MRNQSKRHPQKLDRLRRDIRKGLESGPARPWDLAEMKKQGRKILAAHKAAK